MIEQRSVKPLRRYYGLDSDQHGDLHVSRSDPEKGLVVLFHGGFWRTHRDLSMTSAIATELANEGWNVWNVEYRRGDRVAWRDTLADCTAATNHASVLAAELGIDIRTVLLVGHSAGGQLAAWTTSRAGGAGPVTVSGLVTLNGVLDLATAANEEVGNDAVLDFLGALPQARPDIYREVDFAATVPLGVPARCLHSRTDERVPFHLSESFTRAARRHGDDVRLVEIPGHHTAPIERGSDAWSAVVAAVNSLRLLPAAP